MTNKERIQLTLGYTAKGYALMIEYTGYNWLELKFTDPVLKKTFAASGRFWQWWCKQWDNRDEQFLRETSLRFIDEELTGYELQLSLKMFVDKHNIYTLKIEPNRWVREEVYKIHAIEEAKEKAETPKKIDSANG